MKLTLKNHELVGNGYLLGIDSENQSEQLIITIENESGKGVPSNITYKVKV